LFFAIFSPGDLKHLLAYLSSFFISII